MTTGGQEMPEPTKTETVEETETTEDNKDQVSSGEDSESGVDEKSAKADANLKAKLKEAGERIKAYEAEEEKRKEAELEKQGKHKELITDLKSKNKALEAQVKLGSRQNEIILAANAVETDFNRDALIKTAQRIDRENDYEGEVGALIEATLAEFNAIIGDDGGTTTEGKETTAWGTSGGHAERRDIRAGDMARLRDLHKAIMEGGANSERAVVEYSQLKRKLQEKGIDVAKAVRSA
jgi:hypothetical protein